MYKAGLALLAATFTQYLAVDLWTKNIYAVYVVNQRYENDLPSLWPAHTTLILAVELALAVVLIVADLVRVVHATHAKEHMRHAGDQLEEWIARSSKP